LVLESVLSLPHFPTLPVFQRFHPHHQHLWYSKELLQHSCYLTVVWSFWFLPHHWKDSSCSRRSEEAYVFSPQCSEKTLLLIKYQLLPPWLTRVRCLSPT
jgi:hypothetical protein